MLTVCASPYSFQLVTLVGLGNNYLDRDLKPKTKTKTQLYGDRSFAAWAPRLWNALPVDIKNSESLNIFKSEVRRLLFH